MAVLWKHISQMSSLRQFQPLPIARVTLSYYILYARIYDYNIVVKHWSQLISVWGYFFQLLIRYLPCYGGGAFLVFVSVIVLQIICFFVLTYVPNNFISG